MDDVSKCTVIREKHYIMLKFSIMKMKTKTGPVFMVKFNQFVDSADKLTLIGKFINGTYATIEVA